MKHKAIDEIEDEGMDEGRFFVWLKPGWSWEAKEQKAGRSFGSKKEAREALKHIYKV